MDTSVKQFRKRNAILHYLQSVTDHPSAETVFIKLKQEIPDLSIGTVYRNLNLFKNQGLAVTVATVKGVERFDANVDPHVHFICTHCDAVLDLMDMEVPQQLRTAAEQSSGGLVSDCQLSFTGLCSECRAKQENTVSA